jgi:hypothetical protein
MEMLINVKSMRPDDFNVSELINKLRNSNGADIKDHLPEGMNEIELSKADQNLISMSIFKCDQCDYWLDLEDEADNDGDYPGYCKACAGED